MFEGFFGKVGTALVGTLLAMQVTLLCLGMGQLPQITFFCTAPASSPLSVPFGLLHLLLLCLLIVGLPSLHFVRLRLYYVVLFIAVLSALPIQAALVSNGTLWCDAP
jgi:hypothetical protein